MQKGTIKVQTENIFPIIKKFLYSDHEIFLRELISNAVDATIKLKKLSSLGKYSADPGDLTIQVKLDTKKKTLTITDRGIGMTEAEIDQYINQIAFSSAEEFVNKYMGKSEAEKSGIIGHFGLGFYSSFMVADKVDIITRSWQDDAVPIKWSCDGSPDYSIDVSKKKDRGTDIVLHLGEEGKDFLDEQRVLGLLKKYCRFLPVAIQFGVESKSEPIEGQLDKDGNQEYKSIEVPRIINNPEPLWKKSPQDLKEEDYKNFYHELYPYTFDDPLFQIHINVDYPFDLTGILYFPKIKKNFEVQKDKIQLYCNQVFVTDSVENIVPDFLTLLHGVIDSPDIPLNVSRSYLQSDSNVRKISNHITKKVADKLEELFTNDREDYQQKWDDIRVFIRYGMLTNESFDERARKFALLRDTEGKYYTLDEYRDAVKDKQTDANEQLVYLYTTDPIAQHSYVEAARAKGYNVLNMDSVIDTHFLEFLERKLEKTSFKRVDSDIAEKLIASKEKSAVSKLTDEEQKLMKESFEKAMPEDVKMRVEMAAMAEDDLPVMLVQPEFLRRMKDMSAISGGMDYMDSLGMTYQLVVNSNHPLVAGLADTSDEAHKSQLISQLTDLAMLSQGLLKGEKLSEFIRRSVQIIK